MSKLFSEQPIFVKDLEDLSLKRSIYPENQILCFYCNHCNKYVERKIKVFRRNSRFLCYQCSSKETFQKHFGVDNPSLSKEIQDKIRKAHLNHSEEVKKDIRKRTEETCKKVYGGLAPLCSKEIKEKVRKTCEDKYGVSNPFQLEKVKESIKNFFKDEEKVGVWKAKSKETRLKKYAQFNSPIQTNSIKEYFKNEENLKNWRKNHSSKYLYENEKFDSSWELALWIYAKDHNEEIVREPFPIEYFFKEISHKYFPDFLYKGHLVELKGPHLLKEMEVENTIQRSKFLCMKENNVEIWSKNEIAPILFYIKNIYGKNYLESFKSKS